MSGDYRSSQGLFCHTKLIIFSASPRMFLSEMFSDCECLAVMDAVTLAQCTAPAWVPATPFDPALLLYHHVQMLQQ